MGSTTSRRQVAQEEKKEGNDVIDRENARCDFCGKKAKQIITRQDKNKVKACFNCIPKRHYGISWIMDKEII